jgi:hypothetical protein
MIVGGALASPSGAPDPVALAKGATGAVTGMVTDAAPTGAFCLVTSAMVRLGL